MAAAVKIAAFAALPASCTGCSAVYLQWDPGYLHVAVLIDHRRQPFAGLVQDNAKRMPPTSDVRRLHPHVASSRSRRAAQPCCLCHARLRPGDGRCLRRGCAVRGRDADGNVLGEPQPAQVGGYRRTNLRIAGSMLVFLPSFAGARKTNQDSRA